jgi:hypothetical protein
VMAPTRMVVGWPPWKGSRRLRGAPPLAPAVPGRWRRRPSVRQAHCRSRTGGTCAGRGRAVRRPRRRASAQVSSVQLEDAEDLIEPAGDLSLASGFLSFLLLLSARRLNPACEPLLLFGETAPRRLPGVVQVGKLPAPVGQLESAGGRRWLGVRRPRRRVRSSWRRMAQRGQWGS